MNFEKVYGAKERQDGLYKIGRNKYEARFGYGTDGDNGYNYRKQYRYKPTLEELKDEIIAIINNAVDLKILSGYRYNDKQVWLSMENQFNYKAAFDLVVQTKGKTLPVKLKLGTIDNAEYEVFETLEEFMAFYSGAMAFVQKCLQEGWEEKDSINWEKFIYNE